MESFYTTLPGSARGCHISSRLVRVPPNDSAISNKAQLGSTVDRVPRLGCSLCCKSGFVPVITNTHQSFSLSVTRVNRIFHVNSKPQTSARTGASSCLGLMFSFITLAVRGVLSRARTSSVTPMPPFGQHLGRYRELAAVGGRRSGLEAHGKFLFSRTTSFASHQIFSCWE